MIINKKMRDGSIREFKVDEEQGVFLLKHDPARYTLDTKKNPKEFKVKEQNVEVKDLNEIEIEDIKLEDNIVEEL